MQEILQTETVIIELLLIISVVALVVRRVRLPYTVALVVVGLLITSQQPLPFVLTSELILALFVPPLVFEAAFHLSATELRRNLLGVLGLAIPGVIVTTLIVGGLVTWLTPLAFPVALVFGALIAATDPVAVVALFRAFGVPRPLAVLVEAESLLNDGTAIVVFNLALAAALTGYFDPVQGVFQFFWVSSAGVGIGVGLGWIVSWIIARVDDHLIEITLTTVLAFGSYLLAEHFHVSGVLAVVSAGLVAGTIGPRGMSPTTRIVLVNFWDYVAFLANSLVFLLIGFRVVLPDLVESWQSILVAIAAVLISRVVVVYGLGALTRRLTDPVPVAWQHVLTWGGLRGAISLALVLSLPAALGEDNTLLLRMTFGVVLFTLLVQGTTMGALLKRLGIGQHGETRLAFELSHGRLAALRAAEARLTEQRDAGLISNHAWEVLHPALNDQIRSEASEARATLTSNPDLEAAELTAARQEMFRAQRSRLLDLRREGVISEEALEHLGAELDRKIGES